jgi:endonuclease/exonuclease/phosphatase family metal-dependent hydrolase
MVFLTWNLNGSEKALDLALTYLERRAADDAVLACFQEVPPRVKRAATWRAGWDRLWGELPRNGLRVVPTVVGAGRIVMVCSADLQPVFVRADRSERMLIARFRTPSRSEIVVVGYHALDRINFGGPEQRGGYQALARRELDELVPMTMLPVVLLGDFNASPGDAELGDRACLYVLGPRDHHNRRAARHYGRVSPPLYAISPKAVPAAVEGSIFVEWGERARWEMYDFVATTPDLRERASARILDAVGGVTLLRPRKPTPNGDVYSDHLPVEAELEFR